jgi:beta-N-acetylhexosaminidase
VLRMSPEAPRAPKVPRALAGVVMTAAALAGCSSGGQPAASSLSPTATASMGIGQAPAAPPPAAPACGDAAVTALSTRDKLAQLLMVGVTGADDARAVVQNQHVGGIMIGGWTDLGMLSDGTLPSISSAGPLRLAVSVDEEGGRVSRLAGLIGEQPSARVLAATKTADEVHDIAFQRGQAMRAKGITIDFAPVVDVTDAPDDTVIGDRSFGNDPAKVTDYAGAYARGLHDAGVMPVLKHFPGHGHGSGDSHAGSVVTPPLEQLKADDLVPYRTLTTLPGVGVMVGHMEVPGLTGSEPASLSPDAYALLRSGNYGGPPFGGTVFTDDLSSMKAISDRFGVADAVLRSLQAGADVALWVTTGEVPAVLDRLEKAVNAGELSVQQVDQKLTNVARAKGPSPSCGG